MTPHVDTMTADETPPFPWNDMITLTEGDAARGLGISLFHLSFQLDRIIELLEANRGADDMTAHKGRHHCYHARRNPSGCDKFYCLRRYRPFYYWRVVR